MKYLKSHKYRKALVVLLEFFLIILAVYIIVLPFFKELTFGLGIDRNEDSKDEVAVIEQVENIKNHLPESEYAVSSDRLVIPKIGVNAPIILTDDEDYGLSKGVWMIPIGSSPDKGGNTIITGHRFRYLPPSNLTFFLFHKLEKDDIFSIIWQGTDYYYKIKEIKIVDASDPSPHYPSNDNIVTMYTCHPIYSTEKRLVVISELINHSEDVAEE